MRFEYYAPTRIIFGPGVLTEAGPLAANLGRRALFVLGSSAERAAPLLGTLTGAGLSVTPFHVGGEPSVEVVAEGTRLAREAGCDVVIGFGGGSALDTAKATAVLAANGGEILDYLEVIGRGRPLALPGLPCMAIPTSAGTGAEVTRNAVLASPEHQVKVSLRSPFMLPRVALVDPELTYSLPPSVTAATGMDALTQVLEPFVSPRATPVTDALCRDALGRAARSLRRAYADGADAAAREDMSIVSLFGGLALANAGLGAVHGFAGVLGGMLAAPHGALCARLLPLVVEANVAALRARDPANPALARYHEVGRILTGSSNAAADDAARWLAELVAALGIPPLRAWGLGDANFPTVIAKTAVASSTKANPITLAEEEMQRVLARAL